MAPGSQWVVLLVDDQQMVAERITFMLSRQPELKVVYCRDGKAAPDMARASRPSVILQDLVMPDVDGLTVVRELRADAATRNIPIIVLSGKDDAQTKSDSFAAGANDYVVKLPDKLELAARVLYHARAYQNQLQRDEAYRQLEQAREAADRLLLNILPAPIAERLKRGETNIADTFPEATILFAELHDFGRLTAGMQPTEVVALLNQFYSQFDQLIQRRGLAKIKTVGNAYMVASGLPEARADHAQAAAEVALEMQRVTAECEGCGGEAFTLRIGFHSGPVVAGVIGTTKFSYDLWGDTVEVALELTTHGAPGSIQVEETTYERLRETHLFEDRGEFYVLGKGVIRTFFLKGRRVPEDAQTPRTGTAGRSRRGPHLPVGM
ncbi:hypothetical protein LBMAG56_17810 [Verrucomicrobiota bacterium]|nr:hypothetical protein LBMAG56_17810 [Verrucomicrobiota bacterium]